MKNATVAVALSIAFLVSGCDAGSTPQPPSSPTTTANESQTKPPAASNSTVAPTKTAPYEPGSAKGPAVNVPMPKLPDAAKENSKVGATAFAEYYFDLINYTVESNDAEPLKQSSTRDCEVCGTALIDPAGRAQITGKWQVGGEHHYKVVDTFLPSKNNATVSVRFEVDEAIFYIKPNRIESRNAKTTSTVAALGLKYSSGWKVYVIQFEETN